MSSGFFSGIQQTLYLPAQPLLDPVKEALGELGVPLIPLTRKISNLVTPHFKLSLWLVLLASSNPNLMIFSAALWFVGESAWHSKIGKIDFAALLARAPRSEAEELPPTHQPSIQATKLEQVSTFFNGETLTLGEEKKNNLTKITELGRTDVESDTYLRDIGTAIGQDQVEDRRSSLKGLKDRLGLATLIRTAKQYLGHEKQITEQKELEDLKQHFTNLKTQIEENTAKLTERNTQIDERLQSINIANTSSSYETQALIYLITFIAIKALPPLFLIPLVMTMGALLGNHLYGWAKRPEENDIMLDYVVVNVVKGEE